MICKECGNKNSFLVMVTDYKPLEMWEFDEGTLTRYCQKDSGDVEMSIQCAACGSEDVDSEGFDTGMYADRPLVILSDAEWEEKANAAKKEEKTEEGEAGEAEQEEEKEEPSAEEESGEKPEEEAQEEKKEE